MRIIDLFSGAGGLTFGFYYRLYKNRFVRNKKNLFVFANEFNKSASDAFSVNYPDITMLNSDIKDLTEDQIKELVGEDPVDIIIGGPPCQSYSTVGPRNYDERAVLYQEYSRILGIVRPKMFLFENVRGILSMREVFYKKDVNGNIVYEITNIEGKESVRPRKRPVVDHYGEKLMDKMEALFGNINGDLGYNIRYKVLNSVDYGVPENRDRVFIVGIRKDLGIKWEFPKPIPGMHLSVREAISDLPPVSEGESVSDYKSTAQNDYQRLMRHGSSVLTQHYCGVYGDKMRVVIHNVKQGQGRNDFNKLIEAGVIEKKYKLTSGYANTYGRLVESSPSPTITNNLATPSSLRCIHYSQDRALTPREGARIQSFPDWFVFKGTKDEVTSQIGNAVPPLLSIHLARQFEKALKRGESDE